jgi:hypothetical protein
MQKILMMTTDQMIDRRILLESDALVADGWELTILAMPGAAPDHPRVVRAQARHSVSLRNRETAILSAYQSLRRHVSLNGALARRMKSFVWLNLISPHEFARQVMDGIVRNCGRSSSAAWSFMPHLPSRSALAGRPLARARRSCSRYDR